MASGPCLFAGWLLDNQGAGLTSNLGAFAALYGSGRPYHGLSARCSSLFTRSYESLGLLSVLRAP
jgi:hypothetical protein